MRVHVIACGKAAPALCCPCHPACSRNPSTGGRRRYGGQTEAFHRPWSLESALSGSPSPPPPVPAGARCVAAVACNRLSCGPPCLLCAAAAVAAAGPGAARAGPGRACAAAAPPAGGRVRPCGAREPQGAGGPAWPRPAPAAGTASPERPLQGILCAALRELRLRPEPLPASCAAPQERLRLYAKKVRKVWAEKELTESRRSLEVRGGGGSEAVKPALPAGGLPGGALSPLTRPDACPAPPACAPWHVAHMRP